MKEPFLPWAMARLKTLIKSPPFPTLNGFHLIHLFGRKTNTSFKPATLMPRRPRTGQTGTGFLSVVKDSIRFKGFYDGQNYSLQPTHLSTHPKYSRTFRWNWSRNLRQIHLVNAVITGKNSTGIIVGSSMGSSIYGCSSDRNVSGVQSVGGLVGF